MNEAEKVEQAFLACLVAGVFPGPTAINEAIYGPSRHHAYNKLNGRQNAVRVAMFKKHGFTKDPETGRWSR